MAVKVTGTTISGRPQVSARSATHDMAWARMKQIQAANEPIRVKLLQSTSGGCITYLEGIRVFLPLSCICNRGKGCPKPEELVGETVWVMIKEMDTDTGRIVLSERMAAQWRVKAHLKIGALVGGTVTRVLPYGAKVKIDSIPDYPLEALLHVSQISKWHTGKVDDIFVPGDRLRALILERKEGRVALSTRVLEISDGGMVLNKEKVYEEAEDAAAEYRVRNNLEIGNVEDAFVDFDDPPLTPGFANSHWMDLGEK